MKIKSDPLNTLRVIAIFFIIFFHVRIFSCQRGYEITNPLEILLITPGWSGVWIFIILAGFLAGLGFFSKKYLFNKKDILSYYFVRIIKIVLPAYLFVLICCIIFYPSFAQDIPTLWLELLTFTHNGQPDNGVGAIWFISTIFWLYLLAPFLSFLIQYIDNKCKNINWTIILLLVAGIGLIVRVVGYQQYDFITVYTKPYFNIDLFLCGMLLNKSLPEIKKNIGSNRIHIRILSTCIFILCYVSNCAISYYDSTLYIYKYYYPTIWLLCVMLYLTAFYEDSNCINEGIFDWLSHISFEMYLVHSMIALNICRFIPFDNMLAGYVALLFTTIMLSIIISLVYHRICGILAKPLLVSVKKYRYGKTFNS